MRLFPIILAAFVAALLYALVMERDRLTALLAGPDAVGAAEAAPQQTAPTETGPDDAIRVMAMKSAAEEIDSAVVLRGETQPLRQVTVMAETTGKVVSDPLRKGAFVEAGEVLCKLDPGTRAASLEEAQAALAEARASRPEAEARVPEAEARLAEARGRARGGADQLGRRQCPVGVRLCLGNPRRGHTRGRAQRRGRDLHRPGRGRGGEIGIAGRRGARSGLPRPRSPAPRKRSTS